MRNPVRVGARVYLRATEPSDAEPFARLDAVESDTFMYRNRFPSSPMESDAWIEGAYKRRPPEGIAFAVCSRADDGLLGVVGIDDLDWVNRTGETFSFLGPAEVRGRGYGTEAKHLLLGYCFEHLDLHLIRSRVEAPNTRSAAALQKQGYRVAGRYKWADVKNGRYIDQIAFDLLRADWTAAHDTWRASRA